MKLYSLVAAAVTAGGAMLAMPADSQADGPHSSFGLRIGVGDVRFSYGSGYSYYPQTYYAARRTYYDYGYSTYQPYGSYYGSPHRGHGHYDRHHGHGHHGHGHHGHGHHGHGHHGHGHHRR